MKRSRWRQLALAAILVPAGSWPLMAAAPSTVIGLEPQLALSRTVSNVASNGAVLRLANGAQLSLPARSVGRPVNISLRFFQQVSSSAQPFDEAGNAIPPPLNPQVLLTRTGGMPFWYQILADGAHFPQAAELAIPIPDDVSVIDSVTGQARPVSDSERNGQLKIVFFDGMEWLPVGGRFVGPGSGPDPAHPYIVASVNHLSTFALALDARATQSVGGPLIAEVTLDNTAFTPNGDGVNDATTISFSLAEASSVTVRVFDSAGDMVRTVIQDVALSAGFNSTQWNGSYQFAARKVPIGLYLLEIKATTISGARTSRETIMVGVVK